MYYGDFCGEKVSALGLGCMRLPVIDGNNGEIDEAAAFAMFDKAIEEGINYFDTAYPYHEGKSELTVGRALARYPREKWLLASKFPGFEIERMDKAESIFEEQLQKCGVGYFDFYLLHNVWEKNIDGYLDEKFGVIDYFLKQKAAGRIRHLGFSCHGNPETLRRFLDAAGDKMEFAQLQINWLDWSAQEAYAKVEMLKERHIPIVVMEPLRGGRLVKLPEEDIAALRTLRPDESVPGWSFRFLQSVEGIALVLSGMSNMEQLAQNIEIFREKKPTTDAERETLFSMARRMMNSVPCTECRYCTSHCPQELDIPALIKLYNEQLFEDSFMIGRAIETMPEEKRPISCIGCRSCEAVCPQNIRISEALADFVARLQKKE